MCSDRQHHVLDKQPVSFVGTAQRRHHRVPEAGNRDVVDAHSGLIVQVANSRRVGVYVTCGLVKFVSTT